MNRTYFATINRNGALHVAFRLVLVLGPSRTPGKTRIRPWLHAPRRYATAQVVPDGQLEIIKPSELASRHRRVLEAAVQAARLLPELDSTRERHARHGGQ